MIPENAESIVDLSGDVPLSLDDLLDIKAPATYLVRVAGDSMRGAGIFSGDLLVVSKAAEPVAGNIVIGVVNGEPLCKRLEFVQGLPVLRSAGRGFPDRYILEGDTFDVWGVVTHSVRAHDREVGP